MKIEISVVYPDDGVFFGTVHSMIVSSITNHTHLKKNLIKINKMVTVRFGQNTTFVTICSPCQFFIQSFHTLLQIVFIYSFFWLRKTKSNLNFFYCICLKNHFFVPFSMLFVN